MYYKCISQGQSLIRYPEGAVTVGKVYEAESDFEVKNTLFFYGDDGIRYKLIPGYFKKVKSVYKVLSPDGFTIDGEVTYYPSKTEARKAFELWKKRYKQQGYYSSTQYGRIHLDDLADYCSMETLT